MQEDIHIHESWKELFEKHTELINSIFKKADDYQLPVYPPKEHIFRVFSMNVKDIKIVLLGQDCYHGEGQANGLAFSVNSTTKIPPSLQNIFKELKSTYPERNYEFPNGNLERWFLEEKIFLLNCGLTVLEGKPGIFVKDWTPFTDDVIKFISDNNPTCIFLLLGNFAKEKLKFIKNHEMVITGVHPSPLSANRGFIGSKIFKKIDEKLGYEVNYNVN